MTGGPSRYVVTHRLCGYQRSPSATPRPYSSRSERSANIAPNPVLLASIPPSTREDDPPMHLIEVERKRELPDPCSLRQRLAELGYREAGDRAEVDTYYSRPDVDYMKTVECLRIRQRDGFAEITYKPPSNASTHGETDVIAKRETNVTLSSPDQAATANQLLAAIGMVELVRVEKARTLYQHPEHDDIIVSIDTVTHAGTFVETEVTAADTDAATVHLEDVETELGIADHPVVGRPYRDLVMAAAR
ncbi:class IV adenylate cyclase [Nocardia sp. CA-119907]|uniref:class IV adenylate cyclase n=1 Tax=Nocardia sp. CA-119907 TaxID=3239973 RepID=UPI003D991645